MRYAKLLTNSSLGITLLGQNTIAKLCYFWYFSYT